MPTTHDEAFREIQLSGKQLVFLFMAATVVSVVIFLCGVLVGRGVRAVRGLPEGGDTSALAAAEIEPGRAVPAAVERSASDAPVSGAEKLTYAERLSSPEPAAEQLRNAEAPSPAAENEPAAAPAVPAPARAAAESKPAAPPADNRSKPAAKPKESAPAQTAAKAVAPAPAAPTEPAGSGFSIQVAAIRERAEADAIAARLVGKGYPAYVVAPLKGAPGVFRVRVGKFKDRAEANATAARLRKEEQFKPWVLR